MTTHDTDYTDQYGTLQTKGKSKHEYISFGVTIPSSIILDISDDVYDNLSRDEKQESVKLALEWGAETQKKVLQRIVGDPDGWS